MFYLVEFVLYFMKILVFLINVFLIENYGLLKIN